MGRLRAQWRRREESLCTQCHSGEIETETHFILHANPDQTRLADWHNIVSPTDSDRTSYLMPISGSVDRVATGGVGNAGTETGEQRRVCTFIHYLNKSTNKQKSSPEAVKFPDIEMRCGSFVIQIRMSVEKEHWRTRDDIELSLTPSF
ncbi:hypothetical protein EOD39_16509 [Acipenser ruthenus]|uniref:Uncharacterized protein n=1 Tax=Acipenser ruthenus TaxID=7906 RepID=A0A444U9K5_ACIRT|nr:hypothetical protein EOD39_16509 [Acipenser ruthenus]